MKKAYQLSTPITSLKFPPIIAMSHSTGRAKDWDDVVTAHADEAFARSWSLLNKKHGKHSFKFDAEVKRKGPPVGLVKVHNLVYALRRRPHKRIAYLPIRLCAFLRVETSVWRAHLLG